MNNEFWIVFLMVRVAIRSKPTYAWIAANHMGITDKSIGIKYNEFTPDTAELPSLNLNDIDIAAVEDCRSVIAKYGPLKVDPHDAQCYEYAERVLKHNGV